MITSKWHSTDVEISQLSCCAKIAAKLDDFDQFYRVFHTTSILREILNAKVLLRTPPFRKGANHYILSMAKGWKHFPKIILNESKVAAAIEDFCAENEYVRDVSRESMCLDSLLYTTTSHAIGLFLPRCFRRQQQHWCCCCCCCCWLSLRILLFLCTPFALHFMLSFSLVVLCVRNQTLCG